MPGFLKVLPLALVMICGPQIITAVFLAMSENWKKNSAAFLAGALLAVTFVVTVSYVVVRVVHEAVSAAHKSPLQQGLDVALVVVLIAAAYYVFSKRKTSKPPKWMGQLEAATPSVSFRLGALLLGVFPADILTSIVVGTHLARGGEPWWYCLPFLAMVVLLEAVPALLVLVLGRRADELLPKVRDWMNANSWIISEVVIVFFIAIEIQSLLGP